MDSKKENKEVPAEAPAAPVEQPEVDAPDRQLFFSTDGSESEEERPRPEEEKEAEECRRKVARPTKTCKARESRRRRRGERGTTSGKLESIRGRAVVNPITTKATGASSFRARSKKANLAGKKETS